MLCDVFHVVLCYVSRNHTHNCIALTIPDEAKRPNELSLKTPSDLDLPENDENEGQSNKQLCYCVDDDK